jgi:sigma-B regulation protein RsbU (phosphoserine phosphatase)
MVDLLSRFIKASRVLILEKDTDEGDANILASRLMGSAADEPLKMSRTLMKEIMTDGQSILVKDASLDHRFAAHESIIQAGVMAAMGAPLFDNDRILGAVYIDSKIPGIEYSADNLKLLTLLANMIAVKITNSRLEESENALKELQRELAVAERIQRSLLPQEVPTPDGYGIFCHQTPCDEVGGDLYDVRLLPDGRLWIALGDVTGHGIGAALLMSNVMAGLQILEDTDIDPLELVTRLETHLLQHVQPGQFVTLFVGILEPVSGRLYYVNAGQNPPLILSKDGMRELPPTGMAVAMLPGTVRKTAHAEIRAGETFLIFSDGIPETRCGETQFDEIRFAEFLEEARTGTLDAHSIGKNLLEEVTTFRKDSPIEDDLTLIVLQRPSP